MWEAAQIPLEMDNDFAVVKALRACGSLDEWVTALRENPGVVGVSLSYEELIAVIGTACYNACYYGSCDPPPCVEARGAGLL